MAVSSDFPEAKASLENGSTVATKDEPKSESNPGSPEKSTVEEKPTAEINGAAAAAAAAEGPAPDTLLKPPANGADTAPPDDVVNPPDFQGEVQTTNDLPSAQTLRAIEDYTVLDRDGKSHTFKSLYAGHNAARRVLLIFVRHFFCGNCQEYLRSLSASVTPESLLQLPVSTFVAVVGCGAHELIAHYVRETGCPFPVYADPTRRLYAELGMVRTLALGSRPAYMQDRSVAHTVLSGIRQGLRQVRSGLATKSGDQRQVGGEFLFEPASLNLDAPLSDLVAAALDGAAADEKRTTTSHSPAEGGEEGDGEGAGAGAGDGTMTVEEKRVTWCHRMRSTRDHAEIPELMEILGLEGDGTPIRDAKRWARALKQRKGTGLTMASQMSRMSLEARGAKAA
ncbi:AhpC/TSA antioxidant enzyme-domain-containing protein [Xylariaceae sp. FL0804]|nr:AhpC/TSA antioxidant enzyme-domain-containing protein [Xylariaceae sp. FL0804]